MGIKPNIKSSDEKSVKKYGDVARYRRRGVCCSRRIRNLFYKTNLQFERLGGIKNHTNVAR